MVRGNFRQGRRAFQEVSCVLTESPAFIHRNVLGSARPPLGLGGKAVGTKSSGMPCLSASMPGLAADKYHQHVPHPLPHPPILDAADIF